MVIGRGQESKIIYVIDFGMARSYAVWEAGVVRHKKAREKVLLRGTHRYVVVFFLLLLIICSFQILLSFRARPYGSRSKR